MYVYVIEGLLLLYVCMCVFVCLLRASACLLCHYDTNVVGMHLKGSRTLPSVGQRCNLIQCSNGERNVNFKVFFLSDEILTSVQDSSSGCRRDGDSNEVIY